MSLRITRKASVFNSKLLFTAMAVFALALQPMFGLIVSQVANAAGEVPSVELTAAQYNIKNEPTETYTGVYFEFITRNINNATGVELRINRGNVEAPYSTFAQTTGGVISGIKANSSNPAGYKVGGTVIITGSRSSGSWAPQAGTWTGSSLPVSAQVIITTDSGNVESNVISESSFVNDGATRNQVLASIPKITNLDSHYVVTDTRPGGIAINISTVNISDATKVELVLMSENGTEGRIINSDNGNALAGINSGYVTAPYEVNQGSYVSGSWVQQGSWIGNQPPVKVKAYVTLGNGTGTIVESDVFSIYQLSSGPSAEDVMPSAPEITSIDAYYSKGDGYTAISVDFKTQNISTATKVELRANRVGGESHSIFATPALLPAVNANPIDGLTGPILITGSRTSSSWAPQEGTWKGSALPESVEVIITLKGGIEVRDMVSFVSDSLATWEQVKPADPIVKDDNDEKEKANNNGGESPRTSSNTSVTPNTSIVAVTTPVETTPVTTPEDDEVDQAIDSTSDETDIAGEQDAETKGSLVNALLAAATVILSVLAVAGIRQGGEDSKLVRLLTIIPAVSAVGIVLWVENFSAGLDWFNLWTLLFIVIVGLQVALFNSVNAATEEE